MTKISQWGLGDTTVEQILAPEETTKSKSAGL